MQLRQVKERGYTILLKKGVNVKNSMVKGANSNK